MGRCPRSCSSRWTSAGGTRTTPVACAPCFAEDGVRDSRLPGAGAAAVGRGAIRDEVARVMVALPDPAVGALAAGDASDRRLWAEWRLAGTRVRDAGAASSSRCRVFRLSNAGFLEERLYWDSAFAR